MILKRLKSRTYWLGVGVMALGYMEAYGDQLGPILPPEYRGYATLAIGAAIMILRELTNKPIKEK